MKYLLQFLLIGAFYYLGELLHELIPLPIPAAVYGLVLLFAVLCTGLLKLEHIEKAADFLLAIMPLMFIPAAVGLMDTWEIIAPSWLQFILVTVITTVVVMAVSGLVTQAVIRLRKRKAADR